ncbi:hypothetical protein KJ909_01205 [Patescibacteria group bacterium]|nr:hypothetical protein [Patescibacteria group bacterium]
MIILYKQIYEKNKQNKQTNPSEEKIISSEVTEKDCKIKVITTQREFFLDTALTNCDQFISNQVSPSQKYVAFQDITSPDSQVKIYSLEHDQVFSVDVLGTSTIKYLDFLADDRLAVINLPDMGVDYSYFSSDQNSLKLYDPDGLELYSVTVDKI